MLMSGSMSLCGYERMANERLTERFLMCFGIRELTMAVEKVRMAAPDAGVMSAPYNPCLRNLVRMIRTACLGLFLNLVHLLAVVVAVRIRRVRVVPHLRIVESRWAPRSLRSYTIGIG